MVTAYGTAGYKAMKNSFIAFFLSTFEIRLFVEECETPYTNPIRRTVMLESA